MQSKERRIAIDGFLNEKIVEHLLRQGQEKVRFEPEWIEDSFRQGNYEIDSRYFDAESLAAYKKIKADNDEAPDF